MIDIGVFIGGELGDIEERREDEVLDLEFLDGRGEHDCCACEPGGVRILGDFYLADVGNVLALLDLKLVVQLLPVVCHGIHAVSALERFLERLYVVDVALRRFSTYAPMVRQRASGCYVRSRIQHLCQSEPWHWVWRYLW